MPFGLFLLAGFAALVASLVIVWLHGLNAARRNPAQILKSE